MKINIKELLKEYNEKNGTNLKNKDLIHLVDSKTKIEHVKIERMSRLTSGKVSPNITEIKNFALFFGKTIEEVLNA